MDNEKLDKGSKQVILNDDLLILIPDGMIYSTDKLKLSSQNILVVIKPEHDLQMDNDKASGYDFDAPYSAPECFTIMKPFDLKERIGFQRDLTAEKIRLIFKKTAEQTLGGTVILFEENDNILIYYNRTFANNIGYYIFTTRYMYSGQIIINDTDETNTDASGIIKQWFSSIKKYEGEDMDSFYNKETQQENSNCEQSSESGLPLSHTFLTPTYQDGKYEAVGRLKIAVPDHFTTLASVKEDPAYTRFVEQYLFIAIPDDYPGGFASYMDAPFSIGCRSFGIQQNPKWAELWSETGEAAGRRKDEFCKVAQTSLEKSGRDGFPLHYEHLMDHLDVVYAQNGESDDPAAYWRSYHVMFVEYTTIYNFTVFFNGINDKRAIEASVDEWVKRTQLAAGPEADSTKIPGLEVILKKYLSDDGNLDAVKVSWLFSKDVLFTAEGDVQFDGVHHHMSGLQLNIEMREEFPEIFNSPGFVGQQTMRLAQFLEQDENLFIPKDLFHPNLLTVTRNQNITGITVLEICASHMLFIKEKEKDVYEVVADKDFLLGIPEGYRFLAEFIKTLRAYNGKKGAFKATISAARNLTSPIEPINQPVNGAAAFSSVKNISVADGEAPFAGVCDAIRKQKGASSKEKGVMSHDKIVKGIVSCTQVKEDTRVVIDNAFSILVPKGMLFSTNQDEIGTDRLFAMFSPVPASVQLDDDSFDERYTYTPVRFHIKAVPNQFNEPINLDTINARKKVESILINLLQRVSGLSAILTGGSSNEPPFVVKSDAKAVVVAVSQGLAGTAPFYFATSSGLFTGMYRVLKNVEYVEPAAPAVYKKTSMELLSTIESFEEYPVPSKKSVSTSDVTSTTLNFDNRKETKPITSKTPNGELEAQLDEDIVESLKEFSRKAAAAYKKIPEVLKAEHFDRMKSTAEVMSYVANEMLNLSFKFFRIDDLGPGSGYRGSGLLSYPNSFLEDENGKPAVIEEIFFISYDIRSKLGDPGFDPNQIPNELIAISAIKTEEYIYHTALLFAVIEQRKGTVLVSHIANEAKKYGVSVPEMRILQKYLDAKDGMSKARTSKDYTALAEDFATLNGYKDSKKLMEECKKKASSREYAERQAKDFLQEWQLACENVKAERISRQDALQRELNAAYNEKLVAWEKEQADKLSQCAKKRDDLSKKAQQIQKELNSAGFLSILKKQKLKAELVQVRIDQSNAKKEESDTIALYNKEKKDLQDAHAKDLSALQQRIERELPMPFKNIKVSAAEDIVKELEKSSR